MQVSKCDLCGHDCYYPDGPLKAKPKKAKPKNGMVRRIICDKCTVETLRWFDEEGNPTKIAKDLQRAGWIEI